METSSPLERAALAKTQEWRNVDLKTLREEIIPRDKPAVMKGLARHWPMVHAGARSPQALLDYIRERDLSRPVKVMVGQPDIKGLYFYRDDMSGLNFEYAHRPFHAALTTILASSHEAQSDRDLYGCNRGGGQLPADRHGKHARRPGPTPGGPSTARSRGYGSAMPSPRRPIMTILTASTVSSPGANVSRFFRRTNSLTSISGRWSLRPPGSRSAWSKFRHPTWSATPASRKL